MIKELFINHEVQEIETCTSKKETMKKSFDDFFDGTQKPYDFAKRFDIKETEVKKNHLLIGVCEEFIDHLNNNGSGISYLNGEYRYYNGNCWEIIETEILSKKLGEFAEMVGVAESNSRLYEFRDSLLKELHTLVDHIQTGDKNKVSIKVNFLNGTMTISDGQTTFGDFCKEDYMLYQLPFEYEEGYEAPMFIKFLNTILPQQEKQDVLSEFFGSVFNLGLKHEKVLLNYGSGANGKSVLFEVVEAVLGRQNVSAYSLQNLTIASGSYRVDLGKKLLNFSTEISGNLESSSFKQLASGEPIEAKRVYKDPFTLYNYARLAFNCNELPSTVERTHGFFRRFLIVPFEETIEEKDQDRYLASKIIDKELPGVFNWLLAGLKRLEAKQGKFSECTPCDAHLKEYMNSSDSVGQFMNEHYEPTEKEKEHETLDSVYLDYSEYCKDSGYKAANKSNVRKRLELMGYRTVRKNYGYVVFCKSRMDENNDQVW